MDDRQIEFRPFRTEDRTKIIQLLATDKPDEFAEEKQAIFDWQYLSNPASDDGAALLIGALGDEIVAANGYMPVRVRFQGKSMLACWSCDTYVSNAYRGRGFGKALFERVSVRRPVMLGFGISDMSDPILAKNNWILDESLGTHFFHADGLGVRAAAKSVLSKAARMRGLGMRRRRPETRVEEAIYGEQLDTLWERVSGQYFSAVERNSPYLLWRYRAHPRLQYRWLAARNHGELAAMVITRHHPVESVIADYLGPTQDADLLADALDAATQDLVAQGTQRVRCETTHPLFRAALERVGFIGSRAVGRFRVRSSLGGSISPVQDWFTLTGESDNDMMTRHPDEMNGPPSSVPWSVRG